MKLLFIIVFFLSTAYSFAQKGYAKDSLQVKLYANITYESSQAKDIKIKKIFCDYCNDSQLKFLKQEGWRRAYQERNLPENKLTKGIRKLTIIIRIAKDDFKNLRSE